MKQNKLKFLMSLVMVLSALTASAYDFMVDGIAYNNITNVTVQVVSSGDYSGEIIIPETVTYNGVTYKVTSIGTNAFANCSGLTSVTIPNSVTSIGKSAFEGCSGLTGELVIPNSVTSIGDFAFRNCYDLTSVTIGNSVTSIGKLVFEFCDELKKIIVEEGNGVYDSRDNCNAIIETASNTLVAGCPNTTIPNTVISIGERAFLFCNLTGITIPNSVTSIGNEAFRYSHLTSVTIPNSVTSFGEYAFCGCQQLTRVVIGDSVSYISNSVPCIGNYAFQSCEALTSVTINSVSTFGYRAFYGCRALTRVVMGDSVSSIGGGAFENCYNLTSINIPNSVTSIGSCAFRYCNSLTSVTIPTSVTSIGLEAFIYCDKLKQLQFNAINCSTIGPAAFNSLTVSNFQLGELVEHIPGGLPSFSMNDKVLVLPNSVRTIDAGAIHGSCKAVVIGNNIDSIASGTFSSGISVAYVNNSTPLPCSTGAFANPQTLYVPAGCKGKYLMSDGWCEFANIVEGSYIRVTDLALDVDSATMHRTETLQLNASVLPSDHSATALDWYSTNTAVATVSTSGLVTAVAEGEVDICCYVDNKTVVCHITVVENHIADSIQLNYTDLLLDWDYIVDLTATVLPESIDQSVTWTVPENDNIYARVVGNKLRVMAMRSGSVTVTATSVADPSVSADCVITIQIPDVNGDTSLNISDVTALIDYLLGGDPESINIGDADVNRDGNVNISDVTALIDKLLSGN